MTLREAIDRFDLTYPNPLEIGVKRRILSEFDGRLYSELLIHYEGAPQVFSGYGEDTPPDTPLLVEYPFEDLYLKLLCAENDAVCGDIARYKEAEALACCNDVAAAFNAAYNDYAAFINRTRRRKKNGHVRFGD